MCYADLDGNIVLAGGAPVGADCLGTCTEGCTDPDANNYDPGAITDDGTCEYNYGCTDPFAANYDPDAYFDDGSCDYDCSESLVFFHLTDSYGDGWNGGFISFDGLDLFVPNDSNDPDDGTEEIGRASCRERV